jgi:hypothetical protein
MKKSQKELKQDIEAAARQVAIGGIYVHYKSTDMRYKVIDLAINTDGTEVCVIYKSLYDEQIVFVRSLHEWLDIIEIDGVKRKRFTLVD